MENKQTPPVVIRRSIPLLVVRIVLTELIFEFLYILWRFLIDINILELEPETLLAIHTASLLLFFLLVTVVQTAIIVIIIIDWANRHYEIRADEIAFKRGIFSTQERTYPYSNIQSIRVEQSLLGKILKYGTVNIYIPTLGYDLHFTEVPKPQQFVEMVKSANPNVEGGKFLFRR